MKTCIPYLNFAGNCRAALEFYQGCFKGEITGLQTYAQANPAAAGNEKDKIIHAEFKAEGLHFMAADGMAGFEANPGNMISLMVDLTNEAEQGAVFQALSAGGRVTLPLERTFWGARFGMLVDRFGIQWMLNCSAPAAAPAG